MIFLVDETKARINTKFEQGYNTRGDVARNENIDAT